jgi:hypothetical protein
MVVIGAIVLAIRPKVRELKPGRVRWIFKWLKFLTTPSFGGKQSRQTHVVDFPAC